MKLKKFTALLLAAVLLCTGAYAQSLAVYPFAETGQRLVCGGVEQAVSAYNVNGNNYFKLRDIAAMLDAGVWWDETNRTIEIVPAGELSFSPLRNPELDFGALGDGDGREYMICDYCFTPEGTVLLLQLDGWIFEYALDGTLLGSYDMQLEAKGLSAFRIAAGAEGQLALLDGHNNAILTATRDGITNVGRLTKNSGPDDVGLIESFEFCDDGSIFVTWSDMQYGYAADIAVADGEAVQTKSYPNIGRRVAGLYGATVTSPVQTLGTKELYVDIFHGDSVVDSFTVKVEQEGLHLTAFVLEAVTEGAYLARIIYLENNGFKTRWVLVSRTGSTRGIMALESSLAGGETLRYLGTEMWYMGRCGEYILIEPLADGLGKAYPWTGDFSVTAKASASSASAPGLAVYPFTETGQRLVCGGEEQAVSAYNINGNNYFKLRDIAELLGVQVVWDAGTKTIELIP